LYECELNSARYVPRQVAWAPTYAICPYPDG